MIISSASKKSRKLDLSAKMQLIITVLVSVGLLSAIALPPIPFGSVSVYLVTLLSPIVGILVFTFWSRAPIFHYSSLFPIALGLMVCISSLFSWSYRISSINSRDIVESVKYLQFFPYLLAIPFLDVRSLTFFHRLIVFSSFCVGIVGFLQVIGFGDKVSHIYLGPDSAHFESVVSGSRITLTGSNPNVGGLIASFFSIYFFSLYSAKKKHYYLIGFASFFFFCFMTQSRTALIALVFGLGVYYAFFFKSSIVLRWFLLGISLLTIVFLVFYLDLSYIYLGMQHALEGKNNSLNVRFENIEMASQRFLEYPLLGIGPAKSSFDTTIDSEYALILQRYGLTGVLLFLSYILYLIFLSYRNLGSHWGISLFSFMLMSILVMITNNIFSGYQLMSFVVILNITCIIHERSQKRVNQEVIL